MANSRQQLVSRQLVADSYKMGAAERHQQNVRKRQRSRMDQNFYTLPICEFCVILMIISVISIYINLCMIFVCFCAICFYLCFIWYGREVQ